MAKTASIVLMVTISVGEYLQCFCAIYLASLSTNSHLEHQFICTCRYGNDVIPDEFIN